MSSYQVGRSSRLRYGYDLAAVGEVGLGRLDTVLEAKLSGTVSNVSNCQIIDHAPSFFALTFVTGR